MQWNTLKALLMFGLAAFLAICCGISVAIGEYRLMFLAISVCILVALVVFPGYAPLLAFAIFCPFAPPLPFVWSVPFAGLILAICGLKFFVERAVSTKPLHSLNSVAFSFALFFGWVFIRYCMHPMLPNFAGWGQNVTGFRAYLTYAIAFTLIFFAGRFLTTRADLLKVFRWMTLSSLVFIAMFIPLIFTKSTFVLLLSYLGVFVTYFDNGLLRFVVLPAFGLVLISVSMLPLLFPTIKFYRRILFGVGWSSVILGGGRAGLLMALAIVFGILLLRQQWLRFGMTFGTLVVLLAGIYFAGQKLAVLGDVGFLRPLAMVSSQIAESTDAEADWEWRKIRWERAGEGIRAHPFIGESYGGMENAWNGGQAEETSVEMSMATGGVHNGFLDCALCLGIPEALLFIYILTSRILITGIRAFRLRRSDPLAAQINCFLCVNLFALALTISVGTDVNDTTLWFYLALSVLAGFVAVKPARAASPVAQRRWEPAGHVITAR